MDEHINPFWRLIKRICIIPIPAVWNYDSSQNQRRDVIVMNLAYAILSITFPAEPTYRYMGR